MGNKVVICGVNTSTLPYITREESRELLLKIKNGDEYSREKFIVANMRLVLSVIKRFWSKRRNVDDIFQAGCVGLIKAIDNFDITVGVQFSTYAVPMIIGEIKRFVRDGNSMRISRSIRDTAYQVLKTRETIENADERATIEEVAKRLNITVADVTYALDAISDPMSLSDPVFGAEDGLQLMDQIGDAKNTEENWAEAAALSLAMEKLCEREKKILYLRYYEGKTQTEISGEVGISQAQVSRLEKTALDSIKARIK